MGRCDRTGKRKGRPPGKVALTGNQPRWLATQGNYLLLVHWIALNVPRRKVLEYCRELNLKVPGSCLGQQMQALATFSTNHKDEIIAAHDAIRATALDDAQDRREAFLRELYTVKGLLYDHMMTDRDNAGRTHMVKDYNSVCNSISDIEGFKKANFDPRQQKALERLTKAMYGEDNGEAPVDAEVRVLQPPELPAGQ